MRRCWKDYSSAIIPTTPPLVAGDLGGRLGGPHCLRMDGLGIGRRGLRVLRAEHQRLRHYEALGLDEFSFWADNSLTHEEKKRSLELFIGHVVPALQEQAATATR